MAASATNTSREIGTVTGVVILGSLMFSRVFASLTTQMNHLHVPAIYRGFVFSAIETGNLSEPKGLPPGLEKLLTELSGVANVAFHDGLRAVLYLSAGLAVAAALLALITLRSRPAES
jgi:sugar phosphate permease